MNIIEVIREIALGLCLALVLPVAVYWGVGTYYARVAPSPYKEVINSSESVDQRENEMSLKSAAIIKYESGYHYALFFAHLFIGTCVLMIGSLSKSMSLSFGLVSAGLINLVTAVIRSPYNRPTLNFSIFTVLFILFVVICVRRR